MVISMKLFFIFSLVYFSALSVAGSVQYSTDIYNQQRSVSFDMKSMYRYQGNGGRAPCHHCDSKEECQTKKCWRGKCVWSIAHFDTCSDNSSKHSLSECSACDHGNHHKCVTNKCWRGRCVWSKFHSNTCRPHKPCARCNRRYWRHCETKKCWGGKCIWSHKHSKTCDKFSPSPGSFPICFPCHRKIGFKCATTSCKHNRCAWSHRHVKTCPRLSLRACSPCNFFTRKLCVTNKCWKGKCVWDSRHFDSCKEATPPAKDSLRACHDCGNGISGKCVTEKCWKNKCVWNSDHFNECKNFRLPSCATCSSENARRCETSKCWKGKCVWSSAHFNKCDAKPPAGALLPCASCSKTNWKKCTTNKCWGNKCVWSPQHFMWCAGYVNHFSVDELLGKSNHIEERTIDADNGEEWNVVSAVSDDGFTQFGSQIEGDAVIDDYNMDREINVMNSALKARDSTENEPVMSVSSRNLGNFSDIGIDSDMDNRGGYEDPNSEDDPDEDEMTMDRNDAVQMAVALDFASADFSEYSSSDSDGSITVRGTSVAADEDEEDEIADIDDDEMMSDKSIMDDMSMPEEDMEGMGDAGDLDTKEEFLHGDEGEDVDDDFDFDDVDDDESLVGDDGGLDNLAREVDEEMEELDEVEGNDTDEMEDFVESKAVKDKDDESIDDYMTVRGVSLLSRTSEENIDWYDDETDIEHELFADPNDDDPFDA